MLPSLSVHHHQQHSLSPKPPSLRRHYHLHHLHLLSLQLPKSVFFIQNRRKTLSSHLRASNSTPTTATSASNDAEVVSKSVIQRIADKLRNLGFVEDDLAKQNNAQFAGERESPKIGEIFIPNSRQIPNYRVGHTLDPSWSTPQNPIPDPGSGTAIVRLNGLRGVVKRERREVGEREKGKDKEEVPTLAELTLPRSEIRRLTTIGIRMKQKLNLGKAGVTEGVVNGIHERWRSSEVVRIVCDDICRLNMKRTHDLLERKTGGLVVWRAGSKIVLYRGVNYKYPYFSLDEASPNSTSQNAMSTDDSPKVREKSLSSEMHLVDSGGGSSGRMQDQSSLIQGVGSPGRVRFLMSGEKQLIEEADQLLEVLGPRYTDWWGCDPLPVDGDLLPAVVPGYRIPFRLLPYGVRPKLTNDEMTVLKRLGRPLPCHFALGRNRNLQGLAAAILKLWEKCEIAKIAVKRGVQNTNSELMAEELKRLTGGTLLSRDKEYMVFYRGKDFLPSAVSSAIEERRKSRRYVDKQLMNVSSTNVAEGAAPNPEGQVSTNESESSGLQKVANCQERKTKSIEAAISKTSKKLSTALEEKARAEKLLSDLEQVEISRQAEVDKEGITEEERYMLRRVGLKMKPFLLLGRRGVFDGTIENMHLHWKYRELVKIICGGRNIEEIHSVARILEAESGGILVAVERVRKGFAIIVYRGKNYQRPARLRPETLLNKKEALKRSIEAQRRESLKLNVLKLSENIEALKLKLVEDQEALDAHATDEQQKSQRQEEEELNPTISNDSSDLQADILSSVQQEEFADTSSLRQKTNVITGKCTSESACMKTDSVLKEKISGMSRFDDDHEGRCSKTVHVESNSPGNPPRRKSLLHSNSSGHHSFASGVKKPDKELGPPFHKPAEEDSTAISARARPLTNKERLLLRRQALKMTRRPVLAVGKSNVVAGIAKAIKDHFKKHPLAVVNVKGRAKGTSVQEVVFQLEQATGALLVSQEPSKIILYRGWGGGVETGRVNSSEHDKQASSPSLAISPELIKAMRHECGLSIK